MSITNPRQRLLIFIVTYNAEKTIEKVLSRIPPDLFSDPRLETEILIIDDESKDSTFDRSLDFKQSFNSCPLTILKNPRNLGYGGNQKLGYYYAIKHRFSIVALLHGDGQYAPEELPRLLEPLLKNNHEVGAVFGSRMTGLTDPLAGGMPLYKFIGNKLLTCFQNRLAGMTLSEWHSGYRIYSCALLEKIPFQLNSNGFEFDTDIIVQLRAANKTIIELPIPTFYGDEISHVNVLPYGLRILWTCLLFRIQKLSLLYDPKFDLEQDNGQYCEKFSFESSHSLSLQKVTEKDSCLILGCGPIEIVKPFVERSQKAFLVDLVIDKEVKDLNLQTFEADLDKVDLGNLTKGEKFSKIMALDVIEHLKSPEEFCRQIRNTASCQEAELILTTPNIAFLPVRLMLLLGLFNYGKRGILDLTHSRLFTRSSLKRLLLQSGFDISEIKGIPAPVPLALGRNPISSFLLKVNSILCKLLPGLFSYQLLICAKPRPTVEHLLEQTHKHSEREALK